MKAKDDRAVSKFMSYVLRHRPAAAGLTLDVNGWCELGALLGAVQERYAGITIEDIRRIVAENDKQRFALDEVGQRIRANQGHSVEIELGLEPVEPPELLFHGTATRFVEGIRREGLRVAIALQGLRRQVEEDGIRRRLVAREGARRRRVVRPLALDVRRELPVVRGQLEEQIGVEMHRQIALS